tara:strand:- start:520 stop:825 length:306 start_codon:yes stop_codon:yes gene_type:complete
MTWQSVLKLNASDKQIKIAFIKLRKAVNTWADENGYPMDDEDDFGSLANRLHSIKRAAFYDEEMELYKPFEKIAGMTENHASVDTPLWKLHKMLKWREDNE